jgi:hypothetical protein
MEECRENLNRWYTRFLAWSRCDVIRVVCVEYWSNTIIEVSVSLGVESFDDVLRERVSRGSHERRGARVEAMRVVCVEC